MGSQARSAEPAHQACTYIRNGMLGKVHKVTCWHKINPTGGTSPDREPPAELDWDLVFHGENNMLMLDRDGTRYDAPEKARNFKVPAGGVEVYRMEKYADYTLNHKEDWLQAIRTGKTPCMDIEKGHRTSTMCNLGNLSYLLGRPLHRGESKLAFTIEENDAAYWCIVPRKVREYIIGGYQVIKKLIICREFDLLAVHV